MHNQIDPQSKSSLGIDKIKIKIKVLSSLFLAGFAVWIFLFLGLTPSKIVEAITGNYNKAIGSQLTITDWNNLINDFVARSGGASSNMSGTLDMGNNNISNLAAPVADSDAATKQYVDTAGGGAAGGGTTYTNWGRADCPAADSLVYSGYGFGTRWDATPGSGDVLCMKSPSVAGGVYTSGVDKLWPLVTGQQTFMPSDMAGGNAGAKVVRCAVCYHSGGACYGAWGTNTCDGGFSSRYSGYIFGGAVNYSGSGTNKNSRECVNQNLDVSMPTAFVTSDSSWYPTTITSNSDVPSFTTNSYLRCAVCCN